MKCSGGGGVAKTERKAVEKNRRMHMKSLCMKLSSLIPKEYYSNPKDLLTQQDHFDQATSYIKELRERIDTMKQGKDSRTGIKETIKDISSGLAMELRVPVIQVRHQDSNLEVVLISGIDKRFAFHEVICVLEEEGAQVLNASFSIVGEKIFHTIHSQAVSSRLGLEASRISERLKMLVR